MREDSQWVHNFQSWWSLYCLPDWMGFIRLKPLDTSNSKCDSPCNTCLDSDRKFCLSCLNGYKLIEGEYGACSSSVWLIYLFIFKESMEGRILSFKGLMDFERLDSWKDCLLEDGGKILLMHAKSYLMKTAYFINWRRNLLFSSLLYGLNQEYFVDKCLL